MGGIKKLSSSIPREKKEGGGIFSSFFLEEDTLPQQGRKDFLKPRGRRGPPITLPFYQKKKRNEFVLAVRKKKIKKRKGHFNSIITPRERKKKEGVRLVHSCL